MNDPLIARFADACGATVPLDLRVDLAGGGVLAEGSVAQPFTLVGRDDSCDVTLSDAEVNPRHVWLQVVGGRVFAVDLGSRTGLTWAGGVRGSGWLDIGTAVKIGPFLLRLRKRVSDRPAAFASDYDPLATDTALKARPTVALEFRNGKRVKDRWQVNRLLTLIGRSPECKIHLTADDISAYHCGLVSTPTGLWVVDLSGRGVVVNGERMRVAALPHAAELWVGRFLIACQYQTPPTGKTPLPRVAGEVTPPQRRAAADEFEFGAPPEAGDLPASHIMADAFRSWGGPNVSGPLSHAITVSGSGSDAIAPPDAGPDAPLAALLGSADPPRPPVLNHVAGLHARMGEELGQWLELMVQRFDRIPPDRLTAVQRELDRIGHLTTEIAALQSEVSRRALEPDAAKPAGPEPALPPRPLDRLHALLTERAARWLAVVALFVGD